MSQTIQTSNKVVGWKPSPITQRRIRSFRQNRRSYWALIIFSLLFFFTLFAEVIANDKPLLIRFQGEWFTPTLESYPETRFGGDFTTEAEYTDPYIQELIEAQGWILWPMIPYSYLTPKISLTT